MKRKRMIKLLMSHGIQRNEATHFANHCGRLLPHNLMGAVVCAYPNIRLMLSLLPANHNLNIKLEAPHE